ncbi:hypothetical protein MHYP_G00355220 [Metynnis hypsauchen]
MVNGFTIISEIIPAHRVLAENEPNGAVAGSPTFTIIAAQGPLGSFLKVEPKALGTVQIMIGVITLLFGIVLTVNISTITVYTGIVYWGALIVKASLVMNVFSAIAAVTAIILMSLDMAFGPLNLCGLVGRRMDCFTDISLFHSRTNGISGVLLVFSLLQLIISICISTFGCKAVCHNEIPELAAVGNTYAIPIPVPSLDNSQLCSNMEFAPEERPPAYTENAHRS